MTAFLCRNLLLLPPLLRGFPVAQVVKNLPTGDMGSVSGWGRSPGRGNGNPLQYSCLGNPTNRGAWRASLWGLKELDVTKHCSTPLPLFFSINRWRNWKFKDLLKVIVIRSGAWILKSFWLQQTHMICRRFHLLNLSRSRWLASQGIQLIHA